MKNKKDELYEFIKTYNRCYAWINSYIIAFMFKPSVNQPLYVQCFHFVKTKAYKVMLQYSSYYIGFFDYDMSYIVALFMCLLFTTFHHWTYFTHRALCSPSSNPFTLVKIK